jgi:hypothetical protein
VNIPAKRKHQSGLEKIEYSGRKKPQFRKYGNRETGAAGTVHVAA